MNRPMPDRRLLVNRHIAWLIAAERKPDHPSSFAAAAAALRSISAGCERNLRRMEGGTSRAAWVVIRSSY
ncbi:MAG: hypothetical protein MZV70_08870 [Desulfobacterales bacterium]|nr:hypothetical protein [Desulfobacterales bacterium]